MDEENKKINLESFFKRVNSVEQIANSALSRANSNLGINNNQKSLIESLSISIEAMQTKIRDIANYIIVEKKLEADREEDRRLEAEDAEQKRQMTERAAAMGETGPQKESVKPAESQGGGGSFLGGLIKTLGGLMVGGFALKYIGPVLLPKLLLLAKTKLFPLIGAGLKTAVTSSFKFLGGLVTKLFSPLTTAPIIGKIFKGIKFASPFLAVGGFLGSKILDFFSKGGKGGGDTGVSSDSNMGATNSTVETDMTDTLKKEGLVEDQKNDGGKEETNEEIEEGGGKEEINEEIKEFNEEANRLKEESAIAEETGNTDISTELKKEASGGDEKLTEEVGKKFKVTKEKRSGTEEEKRKFFEVEPKISYAVDREKWMGEINFDSQYDLKKQAGIYGSVGRRSRDFNQSNAIQAWVNTVSTLLFTANYAKLYQEDFATIGHRWEPINGFKINVEANYSHRNPLKNNNLYKPFDFMNREYTPNLPINEVLVEQRDLLAPNNAFSTGINLAYTPHSYYRFFGDKKEAISSNYPTFELNYKQGIRKVFDSDVDYSFVSFSLHQSQSVRLIDDISYHVEAGKFLNRNKMYFADFKSFTTNPTYFVSNNQSNSYYLLDYYAFNSNNYYLEGHFSLEDNHILLKHLPLFNRTNWKESLHFNYLWTEKEKHFYEFGYGLNRMFLLVNLGVFAAFEDHKFEAVGFRIGLNID